MPEETPKKTQEKGSLAGKLLLAMPSIADDRFERAVIFMCAHDDKGAMGLRVNHMMSEIGFDKVIAQTGIKSDIAIDLDDVDVLDGGPVEGARGFLLHSGEFRQKDTILVSDDYGVSGTVDALRNVVEGNGPGQMLFVLGHSGWSAGQLDRELQQNTWLVADATPDLIFNTPNDKKWEAALASMGIDVGMLSATSGNA